MTNRSTVQRETTVLLALREFAGREPLSVNEVKHACDAVKHDNLRYDEATVRIVLNALAKQGRVHSRIETKEERRARARAEDSRGFPATLFSIAHPVPTRSTTSLVKGIVLGDGSTVEPNARKAARKYYAKNKKKINAKNYARNKAAIVAKRGGYRADETIAASIGAIIESHVQKRNHELNLKVAELEARLAKINEFLRRA